MTPIHCGSWEKLKLIPVVGILIEDTYTFLGLFKLTGHYILKLPCDTVHCSKCHINKIELNSVKYMLDRPPIYRKADAYLV